MEVSALSTIVIYLTDTSPYSRYSTQFEDGGHGHVHEDFPHSHFCNNCKLKKLTTN